MSDSRVFCACAVAALAVFVTAASATELAKPVDMSLGFSPANALLDQTSTEESVSIKTSESSRHYGWVEDIEAKTWKGFLVGMDGFDGFVEPVGMPIYFEDPFIKTDLRLIYIYHDIAGDSVVRGGDAHVVAAQIRVALTERLSLLAYKDGYTWIDTGITPDGNGWNDLGLGLKYAFYADPDNQFIASGGVKFELSQGSREVFQGQEMEIAPFLSMAKAWGDWYFMSSMTGRIPTGDSASCSLVWNVHLDYALTETFRPLVEIHGIHWLSNGDRVALKHDFLDVGSWGATDVAGTDFFSLGMGFRWDITDMINLGSTIEIPLEGFDENLQHYRWTVNTVFRF